MVCLWHFSAVPTAPSNVGYRGQTGRHMLNASSSHFDPRSGHLATVRSPRGRHVEAECSSGWSRQWPVLAPETFVEPEPGGKLLGHSAVTLDRNLLSDHGLPTCVPKIDRN
jgi:hypothetical protein